MIASEATFLDVLGSCLGAGVSLADGLARIAATGREAARWAERVRPFVGPRTPLATSLFSARALDAEERALLGAATTPAAEERSLHAIAVRRRRREALRASVLSGLGGPFAIAALTVVLGPLPNLIGSGPYVWPVLRGLVWVTLLAAAVALGVPAALRSPALGPKILALCARVPGLSTLAAKHAEADLLTLAAPFVEAPDAGSEPLVAAAALVGWSPLGARVRGAAAGATLEAALGRLAPYLTEETNLSILSGTASRRLAARLGERGDELAAALAKGMRLWTRIAAYALVVVLSIDGLVSLVSRGLPGMPTLPGGTPSAEQKELEELLRELDGTPRPQPPPP